jgi:hypothetical protein
MCGAERLLLTGQTIVFAVWRIGSSAAVANGVVSVGSDDGKLYAFGLPSATHARAAAAVSGDGSGPPRRSRRRRSFKSCVAWRSGRSSRRRYRAAGMAWSRTRSDNYVPGRLASDQPVRCRLPLMTVPAPMLCAALSYCASLICSRYQPSETP